MTLHVIEAIHKLIHRDSHRHHVPAHPPFGHTKDNAFGVINDVVNVVGAIVRQSGNLTRRIDQASLRRQAFDEVCVRFNVNRRGDGIDERRNVRRSAHLIEFAHALQLGNDGEEINRFAAFVQGINRFINPRVFFEIEILSVNNWNNTNDRVGVKEERA